MSWGSWVEYDRYPSKDGTHLIRLYERFDHEGRRFTKNDKVRLTAGEIRYLREREAVKATEGSGAAAAAVYTG